MSATSQGKWTSDTCGGQPSLADHTRWSTELLSGANVGTGVERIRSPIPIVLLPLQSPRSTLAATRWTLPRTRLRCRQCSFYTSILRRGAHQSGAMTRTGRHAGSVHTSGAGVAAGPPGIWRGVFGASTPTVAGQRSGHTPAPHARVGRAAGTTAATVVARLPVSSRCHQRLGRISERNSTSLKGLNLYV